MEEILHVACRFLKATFKPAGSRTEAKYFFFLHLFIYLLPRWQNWVHVCNGPCVRVRGQLKRVDSFNLTCGFSESNCGLLVCWQAQLPIHHLLFLALFFDIMIK